MSILSRGKLTGNGKNIQFVPAGTAGTIYVNPAAYKNIFQGFCRFQWQHHY